MGDPEIWLGNAEMVKKIFEFLDVQYTQREHGSMIIAEGEFADKLLSITYLPDNDKECGFQFRTCNTRRSLGGALLRNCCSFEFDIEKKPVFENGIATGKIKDYKIVKIFSFVGNIGITKDGITAAIDI